MISLLGEEFEEDRGETLEYHPLEIRDMTGVRDRQPVPQHESDVEEELGYSPTSM